MEGNEKIFISFGIIFICCLAYGYILDFIRYRKFRKGIEARQKRLANDG